MLGGQTFHAHSGAWTFVGGRPGEKGWVLLPCVTPFVGVRRRSQTPQFTEEAPYNEVAK